MTHLKNSDLDTMIISYRANALKRKKFLISNSYLVIQFII